MSDVALGVPAGIVTSAFGGRKAKQKRVGLQPNGQHANGLDVQSRAHSVYQNARMYFRLRSMFPSTALWNDRHPAYFEKEERLEVSFTARVELVAFRHTIPIEEGAIMNTPVRVAVTGAAGQIGYSLLFRIANGDLLGPDTPVIINLVELPAAVSAAEGVVMELEDGAFPLLAGTKVTSDLDDGFGDVDVALLVGARPRGPGMERADLLQANGTIFIGQGKAIDANAKEDVKVVVVVNPATPRLIAAANAKRTNPANYTAMTRLDQNRAIAQLAKQRVLQFIGRRPGGLGQSLEHHVSQLVRRNHQRQPRNRDDPDEAWLQGDFLTTVKSVECYCQARGKSSAASAANASRPHIHVVDRSHERGDD